LFSSTWPHSHLLQSFTFWAFFWLINLRLRSMFQIVVALRSLRLQRITVKYGRCSLKCGHRDITSFGTVARIMVANRFINTNNQNVELFWLMTEPEKLMSYKLSKNSTFWCISLKYISHDFQLILYFIDMIYIIISFHLTVNFIIRLSDKILLKV
jgi:hypothetical protein